MGRKLKITFPIFVIAVIVVAFLLIGDSNYEVQEEEGEILFKEMPIKYSLDIDTGTSDGDGANDFYEIQRVEWALDIIEESTEGIVTFQEVYFDEDADIIIKGFIPYDNEDSDFITAGLGGPTNVTGNKIVQSEVDFFPTLLNSWRGETNLYVSGGWLWESTEYSLQDYLSWEDGDCDDFPLTEVHEILHAFGFGHIYNDGYSIMSPIKHGIQACKVKEMDEKTISCMKNIYSDGKIDGNCSELNFYPWEEEPEIEDFKWDSLPISYSVSYCNDRQKDNLRKAVDVLEKYSEQDLYEFNDMGIGEVNFVCKDSFEDTPLNMETDFWDTTVYFPSAQPSFSFEEDKINGVEITLFAQERQCGGIEIHELFHGLGLRNHYGRWMEYETEVCDTRNMVIGRKSIDKLEEIYGLSEEEAS